MKKSHLFGGEYIIIIMLYQFLIANIENAILHIAIIS